ncbi:MAG TPA: tetratricopeptide repeat protein, partial [Woeseiaceae bacterium]|nr:tetratricopeptide repeat protein [Woeseiaceae bacterium]
MTFNRFNVGLFSLMLSIGLIASELNDETQAHLREVEIALENLDYKMVIQKYIDATKASNDLEIIKQAAWLSEKYKFNKEALSLGHHWVELDKKNNAALLFLINRQIDSDLILAAKRNLKDLLLMHEGSSDEVLLGVLPLLSDRNKDGLQKLIYYFTKIYNKSSYVRYAYSSVLLKNSDITQAIKEVRIAMDLNPGWEKPKLLFARTLLLSGQNQEAIEYIARIIGDQLNPSSEARLELALAYMSSERLEDALGQVSQILLETRSNEALRLMAIINFRLGHYDSAWFDLNELHAKDLYRMDAMFYMARISEVRSNFNEALSYYSSVTSGVNAVYSQKRVVTLLVSMNKIDEAKNHLREFGQK